MEDEGVVFEGLRLGSTQAFGEVLDSYDASMRRLARLYVPEDQVGALLRQTWSTALPGLDMFTWHTTLRAWVTGIFVTYGRAWRSSAAGTAPATAAHTRAPALGPPTARAPDGPEVSPDPVPWGSLGWSGRWGPDGWQLLEDVMATQPLDVREVLWLRDVETWPWREVLDALGLTAAQGRELLVAGRAALAAAVADHVGADPDPHGEGRLRTDGVATLLASLRPVHPPPVVDRELQRLFATWRRQRGVRPWHRWRWELTRRRDR
ncbi:RNA polymerase sigma factor [Aquipuribacter sp. MA13-6]|uniref:RNA polymerase sigma factor n=1 Tax=unclassified Aquipuribacter TaxID=2635084 RepID=UPI003EEC3D36